jgi:RNA polymerase sigma-70 factor (sigma-E family)
VRGNGRQTSSLTADGWEVDVGEEAGFTWFFRAEFPAVVRTAHLIVNDRQRAEDIAQDAFAQLLVHWSKVSRYERPDAWVRRVAIRMASRSATRERLRPHLERSAPSAPTLEPQDVDLMRAVAELPIQQRVAVVLFYFEDRPTPEIAHIMGCSEATVRVHLFKARRQLAQALGEEVPDDDRSTAP